MSSADPPCKRRPLPDAGGGAAGNGTPQGPSTGMLVALHEATLELAAVHDVDELCRRAVELGCSRLGFDRLSIWFLGDDGCSAQGVYGLDESGQVRSERGSRYQFDPDSATAEALRSRLRWARRDGVPLNNQDMRVVGGRMGGVSTLRSADGTFGVIYVDNLRFGQPITDAQFELLALYGGTLGHLIARLRVEEELRRSEARIASILRSAPIGIGLVFDDLITEANEHLCDMLRLPREEVIGRDHRLLFAPIGEYERIAASVTPQLCERGYSDRVETQLIRGDGELIEVSIGAALISPGDLDGGITFTARDITGRRRAERRLRASDERYRAVFEASSSGIVVLTPDGCFLEINPSAEEALGYTNEELRGRCVLDLNAIPDRDRDRLAAAFAERVGGRRVAPYNVTLNHRDGSARIASITGSVVHDAEGRPSEVHLLVTDVTELVELEARAQQTQRLESLGVLAGGIAHDFNNLLTGVLGNAELAKLALAPESGARRFIEQIEIGARSAGELANKMLAYSGRSGLAAQSLDLCTLVDGMAGTIDAAAPQKVRIRRDLQRDLPPVVGDPEQLRQVVSSLVANAVEAVGDQPGEVSIRTFPARLTSQELARTYVDDELPSGEYVVLEIADTGHGADAATVSRMFEPFFTTRFPGRGLGLAAVLGIVRGHQGAISVRSRPGAGTVFRVLLPAVATAVSEGTPEVEHTDGATPGKGLVLVADDEQMVRGVARAALEASGFDVIEADDWREAADVFAREQSRICAAVIDLTMPRTGSEEALRRMRLLRPDVPVVVTSGFPREDALAKLPNPDEFLFLLKPFGPSELVATLEAALSR